MPLLVIKEILLHITNTIFTGFNQKQLTAHTITVALDMSKAFDSVTIHKFIKKLIHTNIPNTITNLITNYMKGHKAYTTFKTQHFHLFKSCRP